MDKLKSTPTQWSPILSNIASLETRRQIATQNMISKIKRTITCQFILT